MGKWVRKTKGNILIKGVTGMVFIKEDLDHLTTNLKIKIREMLLEMNDQAKTIEIHITIENQK